MNAAGRVSAEPEVWTDGSLVEDKVSGVSSSGPGFFTGHPGRLWTDRGWRHLDDGIGGDRVLQSCRGFCSVPGLLQTVQRAEFWAVILALQAADGIGVIRHVGRLLYGDVGSRPPQLVKDGDLIMLVGRMLGHRGLDTVRVTKVKGLADEAMVRDGRVRDLDRVGNNAADDAADYGRRRVPVAVIAPLEMLRFGHTLLVFWLHCLLSWGPSVGLLLL